MPKRTSLLQYCRRSVLKRARPAWSTIELGESGLPLGLGPISGGSCPWRKKDGPSPRTAPNPASHCRPWAEKLVQPRADEKIKMIARKSCERIGILGRGMRRIGVGRSRRHSCPGILMTSWGRERAMGDAILGVAPSSVVASKSDESHAACPATRRRAATTTRDRQQTGYRECRASDRQERNAGFSPCARAAQS